MSTDWPPETTVAYLGPEGTYSYSAVMSFFGSGVQARPCTAIADVFANVRQSEVDYGVVPVENSSEGSVTMTLDCFNEGGLCIYGEILVRIHHCLLISEDTRREGIRRIVSHQQSLGQCREWLHSHFPDVERVSVSSNGEAARRAAQEPGTAAIAGRMAAQLNGLTMAAENIEDTHDNTTRFLVIATECRPPRAKVEKTSLIISTPNAPGTLFRTLEPFNRHGVNLTRLESRPSRIEAWSYAFYVDLIGHVDDEPVKLALHELKQNALAVKVLGSYPVAVSNER